MIGVELGDDIADRAQADGVGDLGLELCERSQAGRVDSTVCTCDGKSNYGLSICGIRDDNLCAIVRMRIAERCKVTNCIKCCDRRVWEVWEQDRTTPNLRLLDCGNIDACYDTEVVATTFQCFV